MTGITWFTKRPLLALARVLAFSACGGGAAATDADYAPSDWCGDLSAA